MKDRQKIEQLEARLGLALSDLADVRAENTTLREEIVQVTASARTWESLATRTTEQVGDLIDQMRALLDDIGPPFADRATVRAEELPREQFAPAPQLREVAKKWGRLPARCQFWSGQTQCVSELGHPGPHAFPYPNR